MFVDEKSVGFMRWNRVRPKKGEVQEIVEKIRNCWEQEMEIDEIEKNMFLIELYVKASTSSKKSFEIKRFTTFFFLTLKFPRYD